MITLEYGDIFESGAEALVNPVNCVGVMGKGLALEFRKLFPDNFLAYQAAANRGQICLGEMFTTQDPLGDIVINFPTKSHWRMGSKLSNILEGLLALRKVIVEANLSSVAMPAVGCGLGGLKWELVEQSIYEILGDLECDIRLYPPQ